MQTPDLDQDRMYCVSKLPVADIEFLSLMQSRSWDLYLLPWNFVYISMH